MYTGSHTGRTPTDDRPDMGTIFEVAFRRSAGDGTVLSFPEISLKTFRTILYESTETVVALYRDHGTSEQFHSELKSDMNVERLPLEMSAENAMILQVATVAFNILRFPRAIGAWYGGAAAQDRCNAIASAEVIDDLIRIAVKLVFHGRRQVIKL